MKTWNIWAIIAGIVIGFLIIYSFGCASNVIYVEGAAQREKDLFESQEFECINYDCWD